MNSGQVVALAVFVAVYALALTRRVRLVYLSVGGAIVLILTGAVPWRVAVLDLLDWDVLAIYGGFMMISAAFSESRVPRLLAMKILVRAREERYAILFLCTLTAFISAFMHNVGAVLMMAPVAIELCRLTRTSLFPYLVSIAISSNVVTTLTMVADPPALILALETGMTFVDFYWYQGLPGLGTLSALGVAGALLSLLVTFRKLNRRVDIPVQPVRVKYGAAALFAAGVLALATAPELGLRFGVIGLGVGLGALLLEVRRAGAMLRDFDWGSFFFIAGTFVLVGALEVTGLLRLLAGAVARSGIETPSGMMGFFVWISVAVSAFVDNVPYTILMIPVGRYVAGLMGVSPLPLLYGLVAGTGSGGNITPVGATANVFACGILEKHACRVRTLDFIRISLPFTVTAVAITHFLLAVFWL